ncbi:MULTISPECIES: hypothetical protein [Acinetobacter]|uniref:Uncharacterized protein n=1 Tax=Acinetobacter indicus TaxID=756892 RepID=A0A6C0Y6F5_9GAMM|nr:MULTISPECIES: hypothetical protein [Acinetobacter]QIC71811.1 hypothetical protein FSC09_15575 [Acinetobacter indicus]QKQ71719.1 hypothetical protein E5Y90_15935 [Acinetobacter sp. 10FS3-1]
MKFTILKLATAFTLTAITAFANADSTEELISNDEALFNNKVVAQVTEYRPLDVAALAKLIEQPSRKALQANLGTSNNVRYNDEAETWFYGLEITTTGNTKEKCVVAFQFDVVDEQNSTVADLVSFNKADCENIVAQQLQKDHHNH